MYCVRVTFAGFTDCESCTRLIHKSGIYGSKRVSAKAWDVFGRTLSRGGCGRRAAVDFVVCFGCSGISLFFSRIFSSSAHGLLQEWGRLASFTSLLVGVRALLAKSFLTYTAETYCSFCSFLLGMFFIVRRWSSCRTLSDGKQLNKKKMPTWSLEKSKHNIPGKLKYTFSVRTGTC